MIDEKVKAGFMKAYEWMLGIQQELMFKKASVTIYVQFTKANFVTKESDGWTVKLTVVDDETGKMYNADWTPWYGDCETFRKDKAVIEEIVRSKCEVSAYGDTWSPVKSCPKTTNSWLCATIDGDQIWVDEIEGKKFLFKEDQWYECAIQV